MNEAGVYFFCDVIADNSTRSLRIPWAKSFSPGLIAQAYDQGTLNNIRNLLGSGQVERGRRRVNPERTANRSAQLTLDVRNFRAPDHPLPQIGNQLDGLPLPEPHHPRGHDVDYFHRHGGGNRNYLIEDEADPLDEPTDNPLKDHVQLILDQFYHDILQESPNKRHHAEGAWTNIPRALRGGLALEDLYVKLEFPFSAVQYVIATDSQWETHFSRFFPTSMPERAPQNFGKCRYYHMYLTLLDRLSPQHLAFVQAELRQKFNTLAWLPHTESDRMWCTKKTNPQRWNYLPANGPMEGPKIVLHPTAI